MTEAPASVALVADREVAAVVRVVIAVVVGREFSADVPTRRAASRRWFLVVTLTVVLVTGTVERLVVAAAHRSVQTVQRVRGSRIERPFGDGCAADADSVVEVSADVDTRTSRQMTWNLQFTTEKNRPLTWLRHSCGAELMRVCNAIFKTWRSASTEQNWTGGVLGDVPSAAV